jgi:hypothetical protein
MAIASCSACTVSQTADRVGNIKDMRLESGGVATVSRVLIAYFNHSQNYYRQPDARLGREYEMIREELRYLHKNCNSLPATNSAQTVKAHPIGNDRGGPLTALHK